MAAIRARLKSCRSLETVHAWAPSELVYLLDALEAARAEARAVWVKAAQMQAVVDAARTYYALADYPTGRDEDCRVCGAAPHLESCAYVAAEQALGAALRALDVALKDAALKSRSAAENGEAS
jgi:hypothetical protein